MGAFDPAVYGVSGATIAILLFFIKTLWSANEVLRKEARDDQQRVLPALTEATKALSAATLAIDHVSRLYDRRTDGG